MKYFYSFLMGMLIMGCITGFIMMVTFNSIENNNTNKVEHIKTGDIDWVCIYNDNYTRSCDVIQKYQ